ncbi:MAG TPA: peptide chain release factor N(5)-glutamine methyltransferase [Acidobacteriota bacterium]|jgi:release factor glutamine methyltransferase
MATIQELLRQAGSKLKTAGIQDAQLDARLLLSRILDRDLTWILTHYDFQLQDQDREKFLDWVQRRASRTPLAYITGRREFYGREFVVSSAVLIPRPETELLVEKGIAIFQAQETPRRESCRLADIGTGSGCIAVSLAAEIPSAFVLATDASAAALRIARENACAHGVLERIKFVETDLLPETAAPLDAIFSNPPYVSQLDPRVAEDVREHEPALAVFAPDKGISFFKRIVPLAEGRLAGAGWLILEIGYGQQDAVQSLFGARWGDLYVYPDLNGIPRCLVARLR